jgi:hypothetical protein
VDTAGCASGKTGDAIVALDKIPADHDAGDGNSDRGVVRQGSGLSDTGGADRLLAKVQSARRREF